MCRHASVALVRMMKDLNPGWRSFYDATQIPRPQVPGVLVTHAEASWMDLALLDVTAHPFGTALLRLVPNGSGAFSVAAREAYEAGWETARAGKACDSARGRAYVAGYESWTDPAFADAMSRGR